MECLFQQTRVAVDFGNFCPVGVIYNVIMSQPLKSLAPKFVRVIELDYFPSLVNPLSVDAGPNQVIDGVLVGSLTGTVEGDLDGATYEWTLVYGDGSVIFGTPNSLTTTVTASVIGTYVFKLTVEDDSWSNHDTTVIEFINSCDPMEVYQWITRVNDNGGGFEADSIDIARGLLCQLESTSFYSKIQYLLPLLGTGIGAARAPLIDRLSVGSASNLNFVDADFSQSTGLQGNGTSKILDLLFTPGQLGLNRNAGLGYWELNAQIGTTATAMGCLSAPTDDQAFRLIPRQDSPPRKRFDWGFDENNAVSTSINHNGDFYGQRTSSTSRTLYQNGSQIAINTASDIASKVGSATVRLMGDNGGPLTPGPDPRFYAGRCGCAYATDGTLTPEEISELHVLLQNFLMVITGRVSP